MRHPTPSEPDLPDDTLGVRLTYRVCVCGSRTFGEERDRQGSPRSESGLRVEREVVARTVKRLAELKGEALVLVVGRAKGADSRAEAIGQLHGAAIEPFPADWDHEGKAAGPMRNARMLASGLDLCVALYALGEPFNPGMSRGGTNDMVFRCVAAKVPVYAWHELRWRTFDGRRWSL